MSEARLKTGLSVSAMLRMGDLAGRPGMVLRRGDADAGGVLLVLRGRGGASVLSQARTGEGDMAWLRATGEAAVEEATADAYVARQVGRDPDLWVVEFDAPDLTPPFPVSML
jgi:hypothetical protein